MINLNLLDWLPPLAPFYQAQEAWARWARRGAGAPRGVRPEAVCSVPPRRLRGQGCATRVREAQDPRMFGWAAPVGWALVRAPKNQEGPRWALVRTSPVDGPGHFWLFL